MLSDDSFMSALESIPIDDQTVDFIQRAPITLPISQLNYYAEGQMAASRGDVACRVLRTDFTQCASDEEFLAKLHCIRNAFSVCSSLHASDSSSSFFCTTNTSVTG